MLFATLVPSNTVVELEEKNSRKPTYFMLALHECHSGMSSHDSDVLLSDPLLYVVTTALFSACGMGIIGVFSLAAIVSMPKQFMTVYLGVILERSATGMNFVPCYL